MLYLNGTYFHEAAQLPFILQLICLFLWVIYFFNYLYQQMHNGVLMWMIFTATLSYWACEVERHNWGGRAIVSETILSATASLVLWEGVYEFTPRHSCNKHTIPSIMAGERSAFTQPRSLIKQWQEVVLCDQTTMCCCCCSLACCCVCPLSFACSFVGKLNECLQHAKHYFLFPPLYSIYICDNPGRLHASVRVFFFWVSFSDTDPSPPL